MVKNLNLGLNDVETKKAAAIIVLTSELARATGGRALFESELRKAVTRAINQSVLAQLTDADTIEIAGGADTLANLRAGLQAAGPSEGYVVAASTDDVLDLATRIENRGGMGVRGGTFVPGVEVVAIDGTTGMSIIPASHISVRDGGLQVRSAEHATVFMSDTPTSPAEMVSLFQTNSLGLLAERDFFLAHSAPMVIVGGGS